METTAVRLSTSGVLGSVMAMVLPSNQPAMHDDAEVRPPLCRMTPAARAIHRGGRPGAPQHWTAQVGHVDRRSEGRGKVLSDLARSVRVVTVRQLLPAGLAETAPGPELGALLAGIEISALTGADAVELLRARARQLSHEQARLLAPWWKSGCATPAPAAMR